MSRDEEGRHQDDEKEAARREQDDTISDSKKCPECGHPIENLRASCPECGYEYQEGDYDKPDAGQELVTGSEVDESGNEIVDESGKVASEREEGGS